jgi:hypothetical protein
MYLNVELCCIPGSSCNWLLHQKILDFCLVFWADETLPEHYKKKAPKEKGEKTKHGAKDQSPGKIWLIVYWPTNDAFLVGSTL